MAICRRPRLERLRLQPVQAQTLSHAVKHHTSRISNDTHGMVLPDLFVPGNSNGCTFLSLLLSLPCIHARLDLQVKIIHSQPYQ